MSNPTSASIQAILDAGGTTQIGGLLYGPYGTAPSQGVIDAAFAANAGASLLPKFTPGQVPYASTTGNLAADAYHTYDPATHRVGIGTSGPLSTLHVISNESTNHGARITHNVGNGIANTALYGLVITGNYTATDETTAQTQGYSLLRLVNNHGLSSTDQSGPVYATGAAGGYGSEVYVKNVAPLIAGLKNIEEHSAGFHILSAWLEAGSGDGGRYWLFDDALQGPVGLQPDALGGRTLVSNNHFNGLPASVPSYNDSSIIAPRAGAGLNAAQTAATTYPYQTGTIIAGYSGTFGTSTPGRGFNVPIQSGLVAPGASRGAWMASNWGVTKSRSGVAGIFASYDDIGVLVTNPYTAAGGTQIGMAIDAGAGPLVVGASVRHSAGAMDIVGAAYVSGGIATLAPMSAQNYLAATASSVTASGNEITPATRATGTSGDGRDSLESSFGIWEATPTPLITNGSFETDTSGWTAVGGTLTRVTTTTVYGATVSLATFGTGAGQFATNNAAANEGAYFAFTGAASTQYTISVRLRGVPNRKAGGTVRIALYDDVTGKQASTAVTLTDVPQAVQFTATTGAGSTVFRLYVETDVQQSIAFFIDGAQVEAKSYATPFATVARTAARVQVTAATAGLSPTQGWILMAVRAGVKSSSYASAPLVFDWRDGGSNNIISIDTQAATSGSWRATYKGGAGNTSSATIASPVTHNPGDILVFAMQWKAGGSGLIAISVNGSNFVTTAHAFTASGMPATANLLNIAGTSNFFNGDCLWYADGTGQLVNADMATVNGWGTNDPTVSLLAQLNGGAAVPTFLWRASTTTAHVPNLLTNTSGRLNGAQLEWATADTQTTVGAAGGASALPATPTGYEKKYINGTLMVTPYYAAS